MIVFEDISKIYTRKGIQSKALENINLHVNTGDIFGVIGFSGAGKSTLIRLINYLEQPTSGKVYIEGTDLGTYGKKELRSVRKQIGMIFQHFNLLESKTIFQNVAIPLILEKKGKDEIKQRVAELLKFVGLSEKAESYPKELSGGQKQRIGIARALATNPSILLCDEATSALDPKTTDSILELLKRINREYNITILMVTHEMSIIQKVCNRVAVMENGRIIEQGDVLEVFGNPQHDSTKSFVRMILSDQLPEGVRQQTEADLGSYACVIPFDQQKTNVLINELIKKFNISVNLLFASMNEIQGQTIGYVTLKLSGDQESVDQAAVYVKNHIGDVQEVHAG